MDRQLTLGNLFFGDSFVIGLVIFLILPRLNDVKP
jgi:hypothetical protein